MNKLHLTKSEASNILDALEEWFAIVVPKELSSNEIGLNDDRYSAIHKKIKKFLNKK